MWVYNPYVFLFLAIICRRLRCVTLVPFLAFVFQFTANSFTIVNVCSGDTILTVLVIYECILVHLFNIFYFFQEICCVLFLILTPM